MHTLKNCFAAACAALIFGLAGTAFAQTPALRFPRPSQKASVMQTIGVTDVTITKINSYVTKAIAGSNNATITGANADGASSGGVVTHTASDAIGTVGDGPKAPTTNVNVAAGSYYQLTSAKSTAGGKALVTLEYKTR